MSEDSLSTLLSSSDGFDRILGSLVEGIHVLDATGRVVYENPAAIAMLGQLGGEAINYLLPQSVCCGESDGSEGQFENCSAQQTLKDGQTRRVEGALFFKNDGRSFPVDYICAPLLGSSEAITGVVVSFRDISRRQRTETLQGCETLVLSDIVGGASLEKTLDRVALGLESLLPETLVSILIVSKEGTHLHLGSAPNLPRDFLRFLEGGVEIGPEGGSCGASAYRREPVITSDISRDPLWTGYHDVAALHGLKACWSWPALDAEGKPLATFAVYHREAKSPTPVEEEIVTRMAASVGLAVEWDRHEGQLTLLETCISRLNDMVMLTEAYPIAEPGPRIVFVNEAFERATGYTQAEVLGKSPRFLQGPDTDRQELARIRHALERQEAVRAELLNYSKTGTRYWVELEISPVLDAAGGVSNFVAVQRDVTGRKLNEQALRDSEETHQRLASQLMNLLDSSLDVICTLDFEGRFVQVSRACEDVWGFPIDTVLGRSYLDFVVPDDHQRTLRAARDVIEGSPGQGFENRYLRADGQVVCMQWSAHWSKTEQRMFCVARDITEAKQNSARIAEQASLLDKANDAIVVRDLEDRIVLWNPSAERLYGWTADEVLGRSYEDLVYPPSSTRRANQEIVLSKGEWVGEIEQVAKDGTLLSVEARCTLVRDDHGQAKSILAINTDISQRKKLEQQFLRAQRMESVGTLAGGIAHDLNNILAPILMAVELLSEEIVDPDQRDTLLTIQESAQRGANMVRQVLSFARGVEGDRCPIQTENLIREVFKIVKDTFPKNIFLQTQISPDLWSVRADATQLHQVLLNLCVNARDAMLAGGELHLSAENIVVDEYYAEMNVGAQIGPHVKIEVVDNGCGMSKGVLEQIFDPFFTTKDPGQGTGLGLPTTLSIIQSHGGFVSVYSEPGRGTRFRLYLPADESDLSVSEVEKRPSLPRGNGETVLVIDDELAVRRISKKTLESFGYQVLLASDGPEAVALYAVHRQEVALVITDMMMPGMDGPSTIQALQRLDPEVRVIAASGIATSHSIAKASAVGIKHFLAKPFTTQKLLETVRLALEEPNVLGDLP